MLSVFIIHLIIIFAILKDNIMELLVVFRFLQNIFEGIFFVGF
jgi:hypothetical protein